MTSGAVVEGSSVSAAWLDAVELVVGLPRASVFHLVVRIGQPTVEDPYVRGAVDELLREVDLPPIDTVRNTIFPKAMAIRHENPAALAEHYREHYTTIRRFPGNRHGTYFGRLVAMPTSDTKTLDQFSHLTQKLRAERAKSSRRHSSRYELNVAMASADANFYAAGRDRNRLFGFPCLSHCSLHVEGTRLHLAAFYRNQYLIERAYGNYLGLGELLAYVAHATGFDVGELLVVAGHAAVDRVGLRRIRSFLGNARDSIDQPPVAKSGRKRSSPTRASTRRRSRR